MVRKSTVIHNNLKTETAQPMPMTSVSQKKINQAHEDVKSPGKEVPCNQWSCGDEVGGLPWQNMGKVAPSQHTHAPCLWNGGVCGAEGGGILRGLDQSIFFMEFRGGGLIPPIFLNTKRQEKVKKGEGGSCQIHIWYLIKCVGHFKPNFGYF